MRTLTDPQDTSATQRPRAAVYTRVSTGRQAEEGYSLAEQERRAVARVELDGWIHVETFREEGVSGAKEDRPALGRLLARLEEFDAVVVSSLDRLGRSTSHLLSLYGLLERHDVALVSLREQIDTALPVGRLLRTVLSAVAEFERDLGRERTSAGISSRASTGKPWGEPSYGYARGDDGHWIVDQAEAATLRRVYADRVTGGLSYNAIAARLGRENVPSRRGGHWTATTVRKLLTSRHVLGEFRHGDTWHSGKHTPIIDPQIWDAAQALAGHGMKYAPSSGGRRPARHVFIGGALRCGHCGEAMLPRSDSDTYVCRTRKMLGGDCPMPPVKRVAVDGTALRIFERIGLDVDATRDRITTDLTSRIEEVEVQVVRADREAAAKAAELARVERDYLSGELSAGSYERFVATIGEQHGAANAEHARLTCQAGELRDVLGDLDGEHEALRRLAELRATIADQVRSASATGDIDALRAAMSRVFERTLLIWDGDFEARNGGSPDGGHPLTHVEEWQELSRDTHALDNYPGLYVEPFLRADVVAGYGASGSIVRRVAMPFERRSTVSSTGVPE